MSPDSITEKIIYWDTCSKGTGRDVKNDVEEISQFFGHPRAADTELANRSHSTRSTVFESIVNSTFISYLTFAKQYVREIFNQLSMNHTADATEYTPVNVVC